MVYSPHDKRFNYSYIPELVVGTVGRGRGSDIPASLIACTARELVHESHRSFRRLHMHTAGTETGKNALFTRAPSWLKSAKSPKVWAPRPAPSLKSSAENRRSALREVSNGIEDIQAF